MSSMRFSLAVALLLCLSIPVSALLAEIPAAETPTTGTPAAEADSLQPPAPGSAATSLHRELQRFDRDLDVYLSRFEHGGCDDADRLLARARTRLELLESSVRRLPPADGEPLLGKLGLLWNRLSDLYAVAESGGGVRPAPEPARAHAQPQGAPANDDCAAATVIGEGTFFGDTSLATVDGETTCGSSLFTPDVWYKLVFEEAGTLFLDTFGSAYDTVLSVHSECPGTIGNTLACDDDTSGMDSTVGVTAGAGAELLVRISGFGGETGAFTLGVGGGGEITGKITDVVTADPLENVIVDLWNSDGLSVASTTTDPGGVYNLGGLAPGGYFATTRNSAGYLDELYDDLPCPGGGSYFGGCDPTTGAAIVVETDTTTPSVDFALNRGGAISGRVIDNSTGGGADGARVEIWSLDGTFFSSRFTDPDGGYLFDGLAPGTYFANTDTSDFADELYDDMPCPGGAPGGCDPTTGTPIAVEANATAADVDFLLDRLGGITGTVTEALTGDPLAFIWVEIWSASGARVGTDRTDASGVYSVGGLTTDTYFAVAEADVHQDQLYDSLACHGGAPGGCDPTTGTPIELEVNDTVSGIDFVLDRLGTITGLVTEEATGDPVASKRVELWNTSSYVRGRYTDSAGIYVFDGLAAGTYFVVTDDYGDYLSELYDDLPCPGGPYSGCDPATGTPIVVDLNVTATDIDFAVVPRGTIAGTVTEEATGDPISGARVEIRHSSGYPNWTGYTDATGAYSTNGLTAGTYYAVTDLSFSQYLDELYEELPCEPPGGCDPTSGTPIEVIDGAVSAGIDFTLAVGGAISGSVTEAQSGDPVSGGEVRIADATGQTVGYGGFDSAGNYQVSGLPAGTYYAWTNTYSFSNLIDEVYDDLPCPDGGACSPTTGTPIEVSLGDTAADVDFKLDLQGSISGTVIDAVTGQPASSGYVQVYDAGGSFAGDGYVYSTGEYVVEGLAAGTYFARTRVSSNTHVDKLYDDLACPEACEPTTGTPIEVSLNATTPGIDFALDRTGGVSGIVTEASTGAPISGLRVRIWSSAGINLYARNTDGTGRYTVLGLSPGVYFATTDSPGYDDELYDDLPCASGCDPTSGSPIQVATSATTRHVDFVLNRSGSISGTVTLASTGQAVAYRRVQIWNVVGSSVGYANTDAAGNYSVGGLEAGTYFATTNSYDDYIGQLYDGISCANGCEPITGSPIAVSANADTPGIDFALNRWGSISGRVTAAATGAPISSIRVRIWDQDGNNLAWDYSDGSGTFVVGRLLPGTYFATAEDSDYLNELYDDLPCNAGTCDPTVGTPITVELDTSTGNVDFALERLGAIAGTVTDTVTGQPIAGVRVEIWDADSDYITSRTTDGAGNYMAERLVPGTYYATTRNYADYLDELYDDLPCFAGAPSGCDPDKGAPIPVAVDATTENIDFQLLLTSTGISGMITEAASGAPRSGAIVDVWDAAGVHVESVVSALSGAYYASLPPGVYFVSTDHGSPVFTEEVYDGMLCSGPAYAGYCNPTEGTPVTVEESGQAGVPGVAAEIDFTLEPAMFFADGFESGNFSAWSSVIGGGG